MTLYEKLNTIAAELANLQDEAKANSEWSTLNHIQHAMLHTETAARDTVDGQCEIAENLFR